jgi:undecaprenyl diphosphate synthase
MSIKDKILKDKLPEHVAIIMDGNGRWANRRGGLRLMGHSQGANSVTAVVEASVEIGIKYLTLYAFSTENWSRPAGEIDGLMSLLSSTIDKKMDLLMKYNVKLHVIGQSGKLPAKVGEKLAAAQKRTSENTGLVVTLALSYSARWEITEMVRQVAADASAGLISPDDINECFVSGRLSTKGIPDPELLIRTSGEVRISNFLLWQIAYSELYFTPVLWPDFNKEVYWEAIYDYQQRERRFGKTGEQINQHA